MNVIRSLLNCYTALHAERRMALASAAAAQAPALRLAYLRGQVDLLAALASSAAAHVDQAEHAEQTEPDGPDALTAWLDAQIGGLTCDY